MQNNSISLYIHIPFCKSKCPYCDFYSNRANFEDYDNYVTFLKNKIAYWGKQTNKPIKTIYFGGGTPSILGANRLCDILNSIKISFTINSQVEITLEVNPDSGKNLDFETLYKSGFNRLSIGMQSAIAEELKKLGRIHSADDAKVTVNRAINSGFENISLDLMLGIPLQTKNSLKYSIDFCKDCNVTHISSYILKIEENTKFAKIENKLNLPNEDMQADLYLYSVELLEKYGYLQYEVSNFSKVGYESQHNNNYWNCGEYIGIGPSAHSFYNGKRFFYDRSIESFEQNKIIEDGEGGTEEEFIMLALRMKNGLDNYTFKEKYKKDLPLSLFKKSEKYVKAGYMQNNNGILSFTPKGYLVSNSIIADLIY